MCSSPDNYCQCLFPGRIVSRLNSDLSHFCASRPARSEGQCVFRALQPVLEVDRILVIEWRLHTGSWKCTWLWPWDPLHGRPGWFALVNQLFTWVGMSGSANCGSWVSWGSGDRLDQWLWPAEPWREFWFTDIYTDGPLHSNVVILDIPVSLPSGRLEKTTRSSPHHMAQHRPTRSETTPPYAPRSSRFGSEPPSVEDDVDVWRYAILSCIMHARNDDGDDILWSVRVLTRCGLGGYDPRPTGSKFLNISSL